METDVSCSDDIHTDNCVRIKSWVGKCNSECRFQVAHTVSSHTGDQQNKLTLILIRLVECRRLFV